MNLIKIYFSSYCLYINIIEFEHKIINFKSNYYTGGTFMNCHGNNKENHKGHNHSPLKHMLHMILCCGLPIVIVGFLPLISRISPNAGSFVTKIVPFLCPIMMIGMIPMMFGGNKKSSCCENKDETKALELNKTVE